MMNGVQDNNRFDYILNIAQGLLQFKDMDLLLERILTEVRRMSNADAGSIYLVNHKTLYFACSQNDTLQKRLAYGQKLVFESYSMPINNSSVVGYVANTGISLNLINAYQIDSNQPYRFDSSFDKKVNYSTCSVLTVPINNASNQVVGVIQLINALNQDKSVRSFTALEESITRLFAFNAAAAIEYAKLYRAMFVVLNRLVELNDPRETLSHVDRVASLTMEVYDRWAQKHGIEEHRRQLACDRIMTAARFHDLGKILAKNVSGDEAAKQLNAIIQGAWMLSGIELEQFQLGTKLLSQYHEHWDGTGFPGYIDLATGKPLAGYSNGSNGAIKRHGAEIEAAARILAVTHEYDILTHELVDGKEQVVDFEHRKAALNTIANASGSRFDPEAVSGLVQYLEQLTSVNDLKAVSH